jgi:hypothetical protein
MRRIVLPYAACLGLPYFSAYPDKRHDFRKRKKELLDIKFVFFFSAFH